MKDMRSSRRNKVIGFVDRLEKDRNENFYNLVEKAKLLELEGFDKSKWNDTTWVITAGRLIRQPGKNIKSASFDFIYSPSLGNQVIKGRWADLAKSLLALRFHRKHQSAPNQRNLITALGYVAHSATSLRQDIYALTPEALDDACRKISEHYKDQTAYGLHKLVAEIAAHCDANGLCKAIFRYRYAKMERPNDTGGVDHQRLDDPSTLETRSEKLIDPKVFKILGELYLNVPKDHAYRFYVLFLTLLACTGRRFSEISELPYQKIKEDIDEKKFLEYFPKKTSRGDTITPRSRLYMPSDVLPIVQKVIDELDVLCGPARETAKEMQRTDSVDLRFLAGFDDAKRFYKVDLEKLGISHQNLGVAGWIRKNGFTHADSNAVTKQGIKPANPPHYTNKKGIVEYCKKDYSPNSILEIQIDQTGKRYFLKDLMLVRYQGLSSGAYSRWNATKCTHSMLTTFLRYFPELAKTFASSSLEVDFTSHQFRHTLNTLLDEGGLSDLLQTEWFGRANPKDTKAYQHTSREKRALMLREDIKNGRVGGQLPEMIKTFPVTLQDAVLKARVQAVHDVGSGICVHNFSQIPCQRHLECSADCKDYVWSKDDKGRIAEQKRQLSLSILARDTAEERLKSNKPKKSSDWLTHNSKKINTLKTQLKDNGIINFDPRKYLEEITND